MWWLVIILFVGLVTFLVLQKASVSRGADKLPPIRTGWLPWLGCALEFGKEPLHFIKRTRDEVEDVFVIYLSYFAARSRVHYTRCGQIHDICN